VRLSMGKQSTPGSQLSAVDVVKNANMFNASLFARWLQLKLKRTSLTTSEVDALAAGIMELLVEDKSIRPLIYDILVNPETMRLRERFLSILLTKFSSGFEGLLVSSSVRRRENDVRLFHWRYQ